jgi:hypothetical protein
MEIYSKEIQLGTLKIELSVQESKGNCSAMFTAKDSRNEIMWKTPITNADGEIKIYPSVEDAFYDAEQKLKLYS